MLTPRYCFENDFIEFRDYFLSCPHKKASFKKGGYLWKPGEPYDKIHYIVSGNSMHYAEHETGRRRIISFHGPGTVFPGFRINNYKIELSLSTVALSDIETLEFTKNQFQEMFETNSALAKKVIDWYSMYVNCFLFEIVHQEFNSSFVKICNLIYILAKYESSFDSGDLSAGISIKITQDGLADILGLSRVHIARGLACLRKYGIVNTQRNLISITDLPKLIKLCSDEAV